MSIVKQWEDERYSRQRDGKRQTKTEIGKGLEAESDPWQEEHSGEHTTADSLFVTWSVH